MFLLYETFVSKFISGDTLVKPQREVKYIIINHNGAFGYKH